MLFDQEGVPLSGKAQERSEFYTPKDREGQACAAGVEVTLKRAYDEYYSDSATK